MNIEKIIAHQIDPVRDIWMKGSSQGKISGWIQTFEIEENLDANTNTNGQKFQKVENDENRFFAITSSKLFKN